MINGIVQTCRDYYDQFPSNTFYCVGRSAVFSFTATVILAKGNLPNILQSPLEDFRRPLYAAVFAGLSSLVHALTMPLFNEIFDDNDQNKLHREFIKATMNLIISRVCILNMPVFKEQTATLIVAIPIRVFTSVPHLVLDWGLTLDLIPSPEVALFKGYLSDWGLTAQPDSGATYLTIL